MNANGAVGGWVRYFRDSESDSGSRESPFFAAIWRAGESRPSEFAAPADQRARGNVSVGGVRENFLGSEITAISEERFAGSEVQSVFTEGAPEADNPSVLTDFTSYWQVGASGDIEGGAFSRRLDNLEVGFRLDTRFQDSWKPVFEGVRRIPAAINDHGDFAAILIDSGFFVDGMNILESDGQYELECFVGGREVSFDYAPGGRYPYIDTVAFANDLPLFCVNNPENGLVTLISESRVFSLHGGFGEARGMTNPGSADAPLRILTLEALLEQKREPSTGAPMPLARGNFHAHDFRRIIDAASSRSSDADEANWSDFRPGAISGNGVFIAGVAHNRETGGEHAVVLAEAAMVPDWNRDGAIDDLDRNKAVATNPFRIWINDDDDDGDLARDSGDDLPEAVSDRTPDYSDGAVDGLRDLVDFFPVYLDIGSLVDAMPPGEFDYRLEHDGANVVWTDLAPGEVGDLHRGPLASGFGETFAEAPEEAPIAELTPSGLAVPDAFLNEIANDGKGVLLLEGRAASSEPLVLKVVSEGDGSVVAEVTMPLSVSPVREMFRVVNLREADPKFAGAVPGPWPTDTSMPPNLPDGYYADPGADLKTMVHIHGFNWGADEIPAAHAEIFKRFHQAGSNARFVGVTWYGDQGKVDLAGTSFDYNENVVNAFVTARHLPAALGGFTGPDTTVFAHSLGNMVATSALVDQGLDVGGYFMMNAAVPMEAYDGEQSLTDRRRMVYDDWKDVDGAAGNDYDERLLAPNWHDLFDAGDRRSLVTWKNRFAQLPAGTSVYNYYSGEEDVLRDSDGEAPRLFGSTSVWNNERVWVYNEMNKGRGTIAGYLTVDI